MVEQDALTVGIEEEYMLVNPETRELADDAIAQEKIIEIVKATVSPDIGSATQEFMRSQVEVGTAVCGSIQEAREKIKHLRKAVSDAAIECGVRVIAASTHPSTNWNTVGHSQKERYQGLANDLQGVVRRLMISGMHVHVGVPDKEHRIDILNQISYFLPHLLALSTSSAFWNGKNTGLKSYRLAVFNELPRTGLPERFDSFSEYERHVQMLCDAGLIEDSSKIWWDIRPHGTYPTLEMRVADICTYVEDGLTIAAIYACLVSMLNRLRQNNQRWRVYSNMLIAENRWRAQRYGITEGMVDFGKGTITPYPDLLEEIIDLTREDAERLGCVTEVQNARNILTRGTSACNQTQIYEAAIADGAEKQDALRQTVDWLIEETMRDIK